MAGIQIGGYGSAAGHKTPNRWTPAAISAARASAPQHGLVQAAAAQGIRPTPGYPAPTGASPQPIDTQNQSGPYMNVSSVAPVTVTHTTKTGPNGTENTTQAAQAPPAAPATPADPRDAQYWQTYNENVAKAQQQIDALNLQDTQESTDLQTAIRELLERKPEDIQSVDNTASAAGGLYTGHRNELQGDLERQYIENQGHLQTTFDNAHAGRLLQIGAIKNQLPIDDNQALLDAVGRSLANPANAGTAPNPSTSAASSTTPALTPVTHGGPALTPAQPKPLTAAGIAAIVSHAKATQAPKQLTKKGIAAIIAANQRKK